MFVMIAMVVVAFILVWFVVKIIAKGFKGLKNGIIEIIRAIKFDPEPKPVKPNDTNRKKKVINKQIQTVKDNKPYGKSYKMVCEHCGASLNLNTDNLIAFCPYCGHKIIIDIGQLGDLLTEKERTKREEQITYREKEKTERQRQQQSFELEKRRIEIEAKEREEKREWIILAICAVAFILFAVFEEIFL